MADAWIVVDEMERVASTAVRTGADESRPADGPGQFVSLVPSSSSFMAVLFRSSSVCRRPKDVTATAPTSCDKDDDISLSGLASLLKDYRPEDHDVLCEESGPESWVDWGGPESWVDGWPPSTPVSDPAGPEAWVDGWAPSTPVVVPVPKELPEERNVIEKGPVTASTSSWMWRLCTSYIPGRRRRRRRRRHWCRPLQIQGSSMYFALPSSHTHTPIIRAKEPAHPLLAERRWSIWR